MADEPRELLIFVFDDKATAQKAYEGLKSYDDDFIDVANAAVVEKDADGSTSVREQDDVSAGTGALFGAVSGAIIGALAGPGGSVIGAVAGATTGTAAGAATGGATAALIDRGFDDEDIEEMESAMPPESSALMAIVEHEWVEKAQEALEDYDYEYYNYGVTE